MSTPAKCYGSRMQPKTLVITTGGTIESFYNPEERTPHVVPQAGESVIPAAMERLGLAGECAFRHLGLQDSKRIDGATLDAIAWAAAQSDATRIVIVQGTDTMAQNANRLKARIAEYGSQWHMDEKTFVFTGAMYPLRDATKAWRDPDVVTEMNDGWANLREAVRQAGIQKPGVYLEMGPQFEKNVGPRPWVAGTVKKTVRAKGGYVESSQFEADDPSRHEETFNFR